MSAVAENLNRILERIARAAERSGRSASDVQLVAVTKARPIEQVRLLLDAGQTVLGENRVQEALPKIDALRPRAQWHLIGHLQTNKTRFIQNNFSLIHSADSARLLQSLNDAAQKHEVVVQTLLQVNTSHEPQKAGCQPDDASTLFELAQSLPWVQLQGLMTMAAISEDAEASRGSFTELARLRERLLEQGIPAEQLRHLSMGMSQDFEVAIEEGATLVRIGSALFDGI